MFRLSLLLALFAAVTAFQSSVPTFRPTKVRGPLWPKMQRIMNVLWRAMGRKDPKMSLFSQFASSTTARHILLSEEETQAILNSAEECAEGECSVDDVAELIYELKEQQKIMENRLSAVMNTVSHLQHINAQKERKRDEVKALVQDLLRVFSTDKAAFPASGFSGDISKKTLTAYDVLSPKPYKKA
eukprot:scaffold513_cov169-Amphora_coffeaeformis.AAC.14